MTNEHDTVQGALAKAREWHEANFGEPTGQVVTAIIAAVERLAGKVAEAEAHYRGPHVTTGEGLWAKISELDERLAALEAAHRGTLDGGPPTIGHDWSTERDS